jgi:hypothetical protein
MIEGDQTSGGLTVEGDQTTLGQITGDGGTAGPRRIEAMGSSESYPVTALGSREWLCSQCGASIIGPTIIRGESEDLWCEPCFDAR